MAQSMAETVAAVNRARHMMPPGTVPPFVSRFDTGSAAVGYLVLVQRQPAHQGLAGPGHPAGPAEFSPASPASRRRRPSAATSGPSSSTSGPTGSIPYGLTPDDVIDAVNAGNVVSPSGNVRHGDRTSLVPTNALAGADPTRN